VTENSDEEDYPPNPVCEYKTHGYAAVLEQPRSFGNAAEELSDELFTRNGLWYVGYEVQFGMYYLGVKGNLGSKGTRDAQFSQGAMSTSRSPFSSK